MRLFITITLFFFFTFPKSLFSQEWFFGDRDEIKINLIKHDKVLNKNGDNFVPNAIQLMFNEDTQIEKKGIYSVNLKDPSHFSNVILQINQLSKISKQNTSDIIMSSSPYFYVTYQTFIETLVSGLKKISLKEGGSYKININLHFYPGLFSSGFNHYENIFTQNETLQDTQQPARISTGNIVQENVTLKNNIWMPKLRDEKIEYANINNVWVRNLKRIEMESFFISENAGVYLAWPNHVASQRYVHILFKGQETLRYNHMQTTVKQTFEEGNIEIERLVVEESNVEAVETEVVKILKKNIGQVASLTLVVPSRADLAYDNSITLRLIRAVKQHSPSYQGLAVVIYRSQPNSKYYNMFHFTRSQYEKVLKNEFSLDEAIQRADDVVSKIKPEEIQRAYRKNAKLPTDQKSKEKNISMLSKEAHVQDIMDAAIDNLNAQGFKSSLEMLRKYNPTVTKYELFVQQLADQPKLITNLIHSDHVKALYGNIKDFSDLNIEQRVEFLESRLLGKSAVELFKRFGK